VVLNDGSLGPSIGFAWSPDGRYAAYAHHPTTTSPVVVEIINSDGSGRQTVSSDCFCRHMVFSPDSRRLAFDVASGGFGYVVQPVSGGSPVTLTGLATAANTVPPPASSRRSLARGRGRL
jgi:Tol biopolymer transport system component